MTQPHRPSCLIIGASRGLGLGMVETYLARGWRVVATVRNPATSKLDASALGGDLQIEPLDVNSESQIAALAARLAGRSFDLLFVNAGIAPPPMQPVGETSTETFVDVMVTNALSPLRLIEALESLVPPSGVIGAMSSEIGSVTNNETGTWEVYRASKAALNMLMRSYAARRRGDPRAMILMAPGWVKTDMGGAGARFTIEENIPKVVDVLSAQAGKPGLRFLSFAGETIPW
jgi:NAD(P)-dependent dehydrogenase (short-subunit alcohol dehydrogenase family)